MSVQLPPSLLFLQPCDNQKISPDIVKCSQGGKSPLVEDHWPKIKAQGFYVAGTQCMSLTVNKQKSVSHCSWGKDVASKLDLFGYRGLAQLICQLDLKPCILYCPCSSHTPFCHGFDTADASVWDGLPSPRVHSEPCLSLGVHSSGTFSEKWQYDPPLVDFILYYSHHPYFMSLLSSCLGWKFTFVCGVLRNVSGPLGRKLYEGRDQDRECIALWFLFLLHYDLQPAQFLDHLEV